MANNTEVLMFKVIRYLYECMKKIWHLLKQIQFETVNPIIGIAINNTVIKN